MRLDRTCKYCCTLFHDEEGKVFANHVRWCNKNFENGDKGVSKRTKTNLQYFVEKFGEVKAFVVQCQLCQKIFEVQEREKKHPERKIYFCSRSCANSRGSRPDSFKEKVRKKLKKEKIKKQCLQCKSFFESSEISKQKYCSMLCVNLHKKSLLRKDNLRNYRTLCRFKFSIKDFPNEFDFSLIEKHGWYSAKNGGNNLKGVSRDHIVSVKYGFENGIDPSIISHPANCQLLLHNSNISKGKNCGLTIEQLFEKILEWNTRYNSKNI